MIGARAALAAALLAWSAACAARAPARPTGTAAAAPVAVRRLEAATRALPPAAHRHG